jgi:hypothetical protein
MSDDPDTLQKLTREMVEKLREANKDLNMTTGRIARAVTQAIQAQVAPIRSKVDRHDKMFTRLFKQLTVSLSGLIRLDEKID